MGQIFIYLPNWLQKGKPVFWVQKDFWVPNQCSAGLKTWPVKIRYRQNFQIKTSLYLGVKKSGVSLNSVPNIWTLVAWKNVTGMVVTCLWWSQKPYYKFWSNLGGKMKIKRTNVSWKGVYVLIASCEIWSHKTTFRVWSNSVQQQLILLSLSLCWWW